MPFHLNHEMTHLEQLFEYIQPKQCHLFQFPSKTQNITKLPILLHQTNSRQCGSWLQTARFRSPSAYLEMTLVKKNKNLFNSSTSPPHQNTTFLINIPTRASRHSNTLGPGTFSHPNPTSTSVLTFSTHAPKIGFSRASTEPSLLN